MSPRAAAVLALLAMTTVTGCPEDESARCSDYTPPASFDPASPVTFRGDVIPILELSCAFSTCHGSPSGSTNGVFLGKDDPERVHRAIVDVRSSRLPTMSFVKPGEPRESFLMRKLDGSHCVLDSQCTEGTCGQSMPRNDERLPEETRHVIRRWIAQGAKND
jgi:hypothetical protein